MRGEWTKDKEPVYVRYVELTPLCKRVLDKHSLPKEREEKEAEG